MSEVTPITHTEKVVAGVVDPITHFEQVIAKYSGGGGGGGTSDYSDLSNKPQINSVELSGNKSLSDIGAASATDMSAEQAKTTGMTEGGSNYITVGGIRVYVSATAPTGARTGDLWIGG